MTHDTAAQDPGVLFVLGTSFSGTTLLSAFLGAHPRIHTFGELRQWAMYQRPNAHDGFSPEDIGLAEGQDTLSVCRWHGRECPLWSRRVPPEPVIGAPRTFHARLWEQTVEDPGGTRMPRPRWLLDSSKVPSQWVIPLVRDALRINPCNVQPVHIHKPVWGYVTSIARYQGENLESSDALVMRHPEVAQKAAAMWAEWNAAFLGLSEELTRAGGLPAVQLPYEALQLPLEDWLHPVLAALELSFEARQRDALSMRLCEISGNQKLRHRQMTGAPEGASICVDPGWDCGSAETREWLLRTAAPGSAAIMRALGRLDATSQDKQAPRAP